MRDNVRIMIFLIIFIEFLLKTAFVIHAYGSIDHMKKAVNLVYEMIILIFNMICLMNPINYSLLLFFVIFCSKNSLTKKYLIRRKRKFLLIPIG